MPTTKKTEPQEERSASPIFSKGTYIFPNGDKYNGEIVQLPDGGIFRQGKGVHIGNDGLTYEGDWKDDKMHGKGKMICASGAIYEENKMIGEGRYTDTNKQVWFGEFSRNSALNLKFKLNM
ncbi:phosphatidylinositol 4-phosphate 5-kinase 7-like [Xenia sp. Carnegie-2017]|uniref:phosphatidylinositol 4-phosphate 5-kinase 7-like n=1 Tax=Xenia sp. Carnegie-2017 TaxID=2897299 RepID=UPI001F0484D5|nr:phosphatidylinositol 4-phosphate 5-kinase 7-like [Xenia sp. Carnegie-2017]